MESRREERPDLEQGITGSIAVRMFGVMLAQ
jgi:hypothetical protein